MAVVYLTPTIKRKGFRKATSEIPVIFFQFLRFIFSFINGKNGKRMSIAKKNRKKLNVTGGTLADAIFESVDVPPPTIAASSIIKNVLIFCMCVISILLHDSTFRSRFVRDGRVCR